MASMPWTFDPDTIGIDESKKTMGGSHEDWPPIGELPQSMYEQLDCGHISADEIEVGDRVLAYWGNATPVSKGQHPSANIVYAKSPFKERNYGRPRTIRDGRIQLWKGTGAYGDPITVPARPDLIVEIVERNAGEEVDHFDP